MDMRVFLVLSVLGLSWCCHAREMVTTNRVSQVQQLGREVQMPEVGRNEQVCTLCEEFTAQALDYLSKNKTQAEIIEILHNSCSKLQSFKQQCIALVDYYAPLFFLEISTIQPGDFCRKVDLCTLVVSKFQRLSKDSCNLCHQVVNEVLLKLKDPDTQLQIIETLLKACDAAENFAKKCKSLVFEYGPMILINAEHFLEANDVCIMLHACEATTGAEQSLHSAS